MKIVSPATLDEFSIPDAFAGEFYTHTLTASGNIGAVTFGTSGPLPQGLSLSASGVLSGTPTATGSFGLSIRLTDSTGTVSRFLILVVYGFYITTPGVLPNAFLNLPYSVRIEATGGTAPYTFTNFFSQLPAGLALDPTTGEIAGTLTANSPGRYAFYVTVTDANHASYTKLMAFTLVWPQPWVARISLYDSGAEDCTFGMFCSQGLSVSSGGKAPFIWAATGLPAGLHIRYGNEIWSGYTPGDALISGVPREIGTFIVRATMTDADGIANAIEFPLHVSPLRVPEYLSSGTLNQPYSDHLRTIGGIPPYTGQITEGALPAGMTFDPATLDLGGTPTENGFFQITLKITDSAGNTIDRVTGLQIGGGTTTVSVNSGDLGIGIIGRFSFFSLSACCLPNAFVWSLESGSLPEGLTLSSNGFISGVPTATNAIGEYKFFVRAGDAINPSNFAIRQVTITLSTLSITSVGTLPYGNVGSFYSQTLDATGGSGSRTWKMEPLYLLPPGLSLSTDGVISGTPQGAGIVTFRVRITDTGGNVAIGFYSLAIYPAGMLLPLNLNIAINFGAQFGVLNYSMSLQSISGGRAPYEISLTPDAELSPVASQIPGMRLITDPALLNFFGTSTIAAYAGVLTTPGTYHPSIRLTDANGNHLDRVLTVTVPSFAVVSPTSLPRATQNVPYSYQLLIYGGGGNFSWTNTTLPPGLTIDPVSGLISGTPTTAAASSFGFVTLTDLATSAALSVFISIPVDPFAITTDGMLPDATVGVPYSTTFSAPGCGEPCAWSGSPGFGLTMSVSGVLSGTPIPTGSVNATFAAVAKGPNGTVSKVFDLPIASTLTSPLTFSISSFSDITVGTDVSTTLFASGGVPPYNWTVDSGQLPGGISLVSAGPDYSSNLAPGFSYLIGRAMQPGVFTFSLKVTDQNGDSVNRAFTWNISRLAFLNPFLPITGRPLIYNQPYTQPLLVLGGTATYPSWTNLTATPPGLAVNAATGVVSGTPINTGGTATQIHVADSDGNTLTGNWSFNVAGPTSIIINIPISPSLTLPQNTQAFVNVTPTNGTAPYTVTASTLPPGIFFVERERRNHRRSARTIRVDWSTDHSGRLQRHLCRTGLGRGSQRWRSNGDHHRVESLDSDKLAARCIGRCAIFANADGIRRERTSDLVDGGQFRDASGFIILIEWRDYRDAHEDWRLYLHRECHGTFLRERSQLHAQRVIDSDQQ